MKANSKTIRQEGRESSPISMEITIKVIGSRARSMDRVSIVIRTKKGIAGSGRMTGN